jgi:hypothetical protein
MAKSFVFPEIRELSGQVGPFPGLHVSPRESPRIDLRVGEVGEAFEGEHLGKKKCLRPPEEPSRPAITVRNPSRSMNGALACNPRSTGLRGRSRTRVSSETTPGLDAVRRRARQPRHALRRRPRHPSPSRPADPALPTRRLRGTLVPLRSPVAAPRCVRNPASTPPSRRLIANDAIRS